MFFILSKTLDIFLSPLIWVLLLLVYALYTSRQRRRKIALWSSLGLLFIFTNPFLANFFLLTWEVAPSPLAQVQKTYDLGIVLTGITHNRKSPQDRVHLKDGADRIMHALWLYQKGKIKKILITGGNIDLSGKVHKSEARDLQALLLLCQVPSQDILIEEKARNTRENALFTQKIVAEKFPQASLLLITSGFHMRRAEACFRKVGLKVDTFSAGFFTEDLDKVSFRSFLPSERAFYIWYVFLHELAGFLIYKLVGYA